MKPKAGQYWLDIRNLDKPEMKSFHGAKIISVDDYYVEIQFYYLKTREKWPMGTSNWSIEAILRDFKLDESYQVKEILSYYD